jgi:hypothetical protein
MSQTKRIINRDRRLRVADDPTVNHALWVLANVLLEIAKKEVDQDGADMPRMRGKGNLSEQEKR